MDRLTRLTISGFLSIKRVELELGDRTVLVGANGSGKSNLVSLFHLLHAIVNDQLQLQIGRSGGASAVLHYGPKATKDIEIKLAADLNQSLHDYSAYLSFAAPDRLQFAHETLTGDAQRWASHGGGYPESGLPDAGRESATVAGAEPAKRMVEFLQRIRLCHFHDTTPESPIRLAQDLHRNRYLDHNGSNLAAFLYMLQTAHPAHYRQIVATVRLAVPYLHEFVLEPDRLDPSRILLRWIDTSAGYEFGPHQLSDGSLRAIALVTALLQPATLLPSVLVIDEPELGLHPSAVGLISRLIMSASTRCQLIVATQSSQMLREFEPEDVVVVERRDDAKARGESTFHRLTTAELGDWLTDYDLGTLHELNVTGGGPA